MTNKTAIVNGGGSGLGEAIGKALAGRGVKVVHSDINLKVQSEWRGRSNPSEGPQAPFNRTWLNPRTREGGQPRAGLPRRRFITRSTTPASAGPSAGSRQGSGGLGAGD